MSDDYSADEIRMLLRGYMGLIVGPEATLGPGTAATLAKSIDSQFGTERSTNWLSASDRAIRGGATKSAVLEHLQRDVAGLKAPGQLSTLAKMRWSAILSLSVDGHLETLLQAEVAKHPLRSPILTVDDFGKALPTSAVPSFKLMGDLQRQSCPLTKTDYLKRRATWRYAIPDFADFVKGSPILCLGLDASDDSLLDLFGELCGDPRTAPPSIVLMADDPLRNNDDFTTLLGTHTRLMLLRGVLSDLNRAVNTAAKHGFSVQLPFPDDTDDPLAVLRSFDNVAVAVNNRLKTTLKATETHRLHDILFSPDSPSWDAHAHGLDLRRTLSSTLLRKIDGRITQKSFREGACVIKGPAACGKTMIVKRLAYDLAKSGEIVLWMRPYLGTDGFRHLKKLMETVAEADTTRKRRVICMIDDPLEMGAQAARDIARAARDAGLAVMMVLAVRTTDFALEQQEGLLGELPVEIEETVADDLDEAEWAALPSYLQLVGVAATPEAAQQMVNEAGVRHIRDTLSLLYWLLPATKASISQSLRSEYFRLGDRAGFTKMLLAGIPHTSHLLQKAYEFVAVAAHYGVSLPIELLVRALDVDYGAWLDASKADGPAWGLLYDEISDDGATVCYRTRNDVVTSTLVHAINGGSVARTGEIARLRRLIDSCNGRSAPVYERFCVHVLVNNPRFQDMDYESGLDLYNRALKALPHPDKTLVHHKGNWMRKSGDNPEEAEGVLNEALSTPNYPYADQMESDDNIYTSLAATVIDKIDRGTISLDDGKEKVVDYLKKSNRQGGVNSRSVHVQATLVLRLIPKMSAEPNPDSVEMVERALADIDRALLMLQNPVYHAQGALEDVQYLEDVRDRLLQGWLAADEFEERAQALWDKYGHQGAFVLATRQRYRIASRSNKGSDFKAAADYCTERMKMIEAADVVVSPQLHEVMVQILYKWRVQRNSGGVLEKFIDWEEILRHSTRVVASPEFSQYAMSVYVHALALCHMDEWGRAEEYFRQLRQTNIPPVVVWEPRDYLLDESATMRLLQGTIKEGPTRNFFYSDELSKDFFVDRRSQWEEPGLVEFAYIEFSFAGPRAVDRHVRLR